MNPTLKSIAVLTAAVIVLAATLVASGLPSQKSAVATTKFALQPINVTFVFCKVIITNGVFSLGPPTVISSDNGNGAYNELTCAQAAAEVSSRVGQSQCFVSFDGDVFSKYCGSTAVGDGLAPR